MDPTVRPRALFRRFWGPPSVLHQGSETETKGPRSSAAAGGQGVVLAWKVRIRVPGLSECCPGRLDTRPVDGNLPICPTAMFDDV